MLNSARRLYAVLNLPAALTPRALQSHTEVLPCPT